MYTVNTPTNKPLLVEVNLNGVDTKMEVDTGASVSIIAEDEFQKLRADGVTFHPTNAKLFTYTGESIPVAGATGTMAKLSRYLWSSPVVEDRSLRYRTFWRHTKKCLRKDWEPSLVCLPRSMSTRTQPQFYRPRPLPCTLRKKVEKELERTGMSTVL